MSQLLFDSANFALVFWSHLCRFLKPFLISMQTRVRNAVRLQSDRRGVRRECLQRPELLAFRVRLGESCTVKLDIASRGTAGASCLLLFHT